MSYFNFFLLFRGKGCTYLYDPGIMSVMSPAEEGGEGLIGFSGNVFFIMERVGGYFFYKLIMGGGVG